MQLNGNTPVVSKIFRQCPAKLSPRDMQKDLLQDGPVVYSVVVAEPHSTTFLADLDGSI